MSFTREKKNGQNTLGRNGGFDNMDKSLRIDRLNSMYQEIEAVFKGDKRPLDLAGVLPMKIDDLRELLLYSELIDINGNLHPEAKQDKFYFIISMYYSLKSQMKFSKPVGATPRQNNTLEKYY